MNHTLTSKLYRGLNRSKTFSILLILILISGYNLFAVTAYPNQRTYNQPDGSAITLQLRGDEWIHWAETNDGYTILSGQNNGYEYAVLNANGDLTLSGVLAHNPEQRSQSEVNFINGLQKKIFFSDKQIKEMKAFYKGSGNSKAPLAGGFPTTGTRKLLVILANFSNTSTTYTQTNFDNYMNQVNYNGTGSVKDYFLEVSYGQLTLNSTVTAWVIVPNTHNYYGPSGKWGEFAYDAVVAANTAGVDFSQFDNDGDGTVDGIAIFHQGEGQEYSGNTDDIWSHSWDLASAGYSAAARTFDGVLANAYTTMPETMDGLIGTIGVMCHEFGHNLGAPDFYDTDYGTNGSYDGTGDWDLQAGGSWNGASGTKPAAPNPYTKAYIYNWLTPTVVSTQQNVTLNDATTSTGVVRYNTPTSNEYFLCENRQQNGFNSGIPGHGMIIYHVDGSYIEAHSSANDINNGSHQGLYPMSAVATNSNGIHTSANNKINVSGCPWPGTSSKTTFTDATTPWSKSWAGANTNLPIVNITETGGVINFCFVACASADDPQTFTATAAGSAQIDLAWTKNASSNDVMIAVNTTNTFGTPVNGTSYTAGNPISGGGTVIYNGAGTSYNNTGLNPNTTYYYKAWSVLTGTAYSTGVSASATTSCGTVSLPFTENFESTTFPTDCWVSMRGSNNLGTTNDWIRTTSNTYSGSAGAAYIEFENVTGGLAEDWLVTPQITIPASGTSNLTFWERQGYTSNYGSLYYIKVSTTSQTDRATFSNVTNYDETMFGTTSYTQRLVPLTAYAGQNVYIAFVMANDDGDDWYIDDINLTATTCVAGEWTGAISSDWNVAGNWCNNTIPTATTDVTIPVGPTNMPVVGAAGGNCRNITIATGAVLSISSTNALNVYGDWTNNGSFTANTSIVTFSGTTQEIKGSATTFSNLTIATGSTVTGTTSPIATIFNMNGTGKYVHVTGTAVPGTTWNFASTSTYEFKTTTGTGGTWPPANITWGNLIINNTGSSGSYNATGNLTTVAGNLQITSTGGTTREYRLTSSASPTLNIGGKLIIGGGVLTLTSGTGAPVINVTGNVELSGGTLKSMGGAGIPTLNIGGNWINNGITFTPGTGNYVFNGSAAQTIGGTAVTAFGKLNINNANGVALSGVNTSASGAVTLTNGVISTGTNTFIVTSTGTVSRTSGHIFGNLQKNIPTGTTVSKTFEIGDATLTNYTPVDLTFTGVTTAGDIIAKTTNTDHSSIGTSTLVGTKSINRFWTMTNTGTVFTNYSAVFNFLAADADAGVNTSNLICGKYDSPNWTYPIVGTTTATSTQITGVTAFSDFQLAENLAAQIDWANLQWPINPNITLGDGMMVYARVYESGITPGAGQGVGITAWIGYSTSNTDPSTWTNWIPATYNPGFVDDNNDEYMADLGAAISASGTYYFASRFQLGSAAYVYGGYSGSGGGFWDGTTNFSSILTVNAANQIDWANLQWPQNGNINTGGTYNVYAQVYEPGVTNAAGQGAGISAWIGYSTSNTDPSTWTNWVVSTYGSDVGNNDEYTANIATGLTANKYYYASRFKLGAAPYVYGGYTGGFWNGTTNVSGELFVAPDWTAGWPKAEDPTSSGFVAKANLDSPGSAYFVVLPSGATAPTPAQVKAGQDANGTALPINLKGLIPCATAATEITMTVSGLTGSTTYDVYFTAEGTVSNLQTTVTLRSVTTLSSATAPVVSTPVYNTVGTTTAVLGGTVDSDGGSAITERGTVWNTSAGVTIANNKLAEGVNTTGAFTHSRSGLPHGSQIFFKAYASNAVGTTLSSEESFYTLSNEPTTHVVGFTATAAGSTSINLTWNTAATGADGYLILMRTGAVAPTGVPVDATAYTVGQTIGDGTVAAVINPGSVLSTSITGLTASTQYSFIIYPLAKAGSIAATHNYYTAPVVPTASATTTAPSGNVYTWDVASGNWNTASSWTPVRTTPAATDILIFDGATQAAPIVTLDFTSPASIGSMQIKNNAVVNFATSDAARTLNIGGTGTVAPQFEIQSGSTLSVSAVNALTLFVSTGYTANISGNITFTGAAHKLNGADASSITFNNGSVLTQGVGCTSNIFTNAGTAGVVNFASGSTFVMKGAGSNPFGLSAPNSKVIFQTGSLYKHKSQNSPSFSGRIYANFELDTLGISFPATGGSATSVDNLTITNGTLNFNMTGTPGHSIKGNIYVAPTGALSFSPASAGTFNLNGTALQTITALGTLTFGANSTFVVNNSAGIILMNNVAMNNVTLTSGLVNTGSNTLLVNGTLTGGSATSYVDGKLARPFSATASKAYPIGKGGNYRPATFNYSAVDAASTVTMEQTESAMSGTMPANTTLYNARYWTINQTGATAFTYDVTLDATGFTPAGTAVILKNTGGTVTSHTVTGTSPNFTATGLTSLSDFAFGDYVAPPTIVVSPATLSGFNYIIGNGPSTEQSFMVSGTNLTASILLTAPADYEFSSTSGSGFGSGMSIMHGSGTITNFPVYVRLKAGLAAGTYNNENIVLTSTGATNVNVTCNGVVLNPQLSAGALNAFGSVCINTTAGPQSFTLNGTDLSAANIGVGPLTGFTFSTTSGGTYSSSLTITQPGGTYSGTVYVKFAPTLVQSYNGNIPVTGGGAPAINVAAAGSGINTAPSVLSVSPATSVTGTTATCSGNVTDQGCQTITARGICYGTSVNPDITGTKTTETGTTGAFSSNLTGLAPATLYHYRAYATSSAGTSYGADYTFTTLTVAPTVVTTTATLVTGTSATLNGTVNANNSSTAVTFEYGTTISYGTSVAATPGTVTGTITTNAAYALTGLVPNTTYHYRIVGVNAGGTSNGNDMTFTTSVVLPTVFTNAASSVTSTSATINGTINPNNATTTATFDFGTSTAYGTIYTAAQSPLTGNSFIGTTYNVTGLIPNTVYWFRANGTNSAGTASGVDAMFITTAVAPTVVTTAATGIGATSATLNGTVNANNQSSTVTIEWGLNTSYGNTVTPTPSTVTGTTTTAVSYALSGLVNSTTYHYRVVATNATGTTYGNDMTFFTTCPSPDPAGTISGPNAVCNLASGIVYTVPVINNATSYSWTVPTGVTIVSGSTTNSITVNYGASAVSGNISVYGINSCGNGTASSLAVTVYPIPVPVINGTNSVCAGTTGVVYTTDAGKSNYVWTITAGGVITAGAGTNSITVTWNTAGAQSVSVNYTNAGSCSATSPTVYPVTVNARPAVTLNGAANACAGHSYIYSTEAGMSNYTWTVSAGGTITSGTGTNSIVVLWNTTGSKTVSVNYNNTAGCPALTATVLNVEVNLSPVPTITGADAICAGTEDVIYTTEAGFAGYTWTVSNGGIITGGNNTNTVTVNWTAAGNKFIAVDYQNANGCNALTPTIKYVTVYSLPAPMIFGEDTLCSGTHNVEYTTQANYSNYVWVVSSGGSIVSGQGTRNITVNWDGSGDQTVSVNYTNANGCEAEMPYVHHVNVTPKPAAPAAVSGPTHICLPQSGVVYSVPAVDYADSYVWTLPAGASIVSGNGTNSITVDFAASAASGAIKVFASNECGNGTSSPALNITVATTPPTPVIIYHADTLTSSALTGNQWYKDGVAISGATEQNYVTSEIGTYTVIVTVNGCSSEESEPFIITSVNNPNELNTLLIQPNPNNGKFKLVAGLVKQQICTLEIFSNTGVLIYKEEGVVVDGKFSKELDITGTPAGMYMVILRNSENKVIRKMILTH